MSPDDFSDIDTRTASGARVYDYLLGRKVDVLHTP